MDIQSIETRRRDDSSHEISGKRTFTQNFVEVRKHRWFFIMLIPAFIIFFIFRYIPMFGIVVAFKDYSPFIGFWKSPWVGIKWFVEMFETPDFLLVLRNTVVISFYLIIFGFPAPIILALMFNEVRSAPFKRLTQTLSYLPHFLSWAVIGGLVVNLLSPSVGIVNQIIMRLGFESQYFIIQPKYIRSIMVVSYIWKNIGWGTIVYLAVITGINPELYEVATIDGANKFRKMWHITLPGMMTIVVLNLVFTSASLVQVGFDMVYNLVTPLTYRTGEVLSTYIYRVGLGRYLYSFSAAVGVAQSVVGVILLITANALARKFYEEGAVW